jgi:hypothetical protein
MYGFVGANLRLKRLPDSRGQEKRENEKMPKEVFPHRGTCTGVPVALLSRTQELCKWPQCVDLRIERAALDSWCSVDSSPGRDSCIFEELESASAQRRIDTIDCSRWVLLSSCMRHLSLAGELLFGIPGQLRVSNRESYRFRQIEIAQDA